MAVSFSQLPDRLPYPARVKARLSTMHSACIDYAIKHYDGTYLQRKAWIHAMNCLSYHVLSDDTITWSPENPMTVDDVDDDVCSDFLGSVYIPIKDIKWDVEVVAESENKSEPVPAQVNVAPLERPAKMTDKEDLYIQPPVYPQFDPKSEWLSGVVDGVKYAIYRSLPEIPTKQNEISVTTDVSKMTSSDLKKLFPNHVVHTRSPMMYNKYPGLDYDPVLGVILPICEYSLEERIANLVKYPHIFRLLKQTPQGLVNFYSTIEIDGELKQVSDIWNELPDTKQLPYNAEFVKEYVVRRYLLEEAHKVKHQYSLYGSLDPYLTLFAPEVVYQSWGYTDTDELARSCVRARVSYKQTRNPVIRRLNNA